MNHPDTRAGAGGLFGFGRPAGLFPARDPATGGVELYAEVCEACKEYGVPRSAATWRDGLRLCVFCKARAVRADTSGQERT